MNEAFQARIRGLLNHACWADERVLEALKAGDSAFSGTDHKGGLAAPGGVPEGGAAAASGVHGNKDAFSEAVREQAHVVGATEIWLSRLEGREARCGVWPAVDLRDLERLTAETHAALDRYLETTGAEDLDADVTYVNSAGKTFTNTVGDILLHVLLHGQYHRGKVNLLLRQAAVEPAPVDYVAFVRGAPAATEADARGGGGAA